jgi:hypothetical protein
VIFLPRITLELVYDIRHHLFYRIEFGLIAPGLIQKPKGNLWFSGRCKIGALLRLRLRMFLLPGEEVHAFLFEQFVLFLFKRKTNIRLVKPILVSVFHVRLETLGPGHVVIGLW